MKTNSIHDLDLPIWHIATEREQIGPITGAEVRRRYASGLSNQRVYTWRDGYGEWLPLSSVRCFADLVPAARKVDPAEARVSEISSLFDSLNEIAGGERWPELATGNRYVAWHEQEPSDETTGMMDIRRLSKVYRGTRPVQNHDFEFAYGSSPELPVVAAALFMPQRHMSPETDELTRVLTATVVALAAVALFLGVLIVI